MPGRVLHLLSQRPSLTGSGVDLVAMVRYAAAQGWEQRVSIGIPADEELPDVGGLDPQLIHPLRFGAGSLPFPVAGMSDVMPYESTVFSSMSAEQLTIYKDAWRSHLRTIAESFRPDIIHAHHIWLLSSLIKDVFPTTPVVNRCHATGLRQMKLCPHLADEVRQGCARNERFAVLHSQHAEALRQDLAVAPERIHTVGAGYLEDVFHARDRSQDTPKSLLYAGKYSRAKGLPWLLDAFERIRARHPGLVLHVAGSGAGAEAEELRTRMQSMGPGVVLHGQVNQARLAELMRQASVFVLPSLYEGLPLVLVEALACGCRLVCTDLPGVRQALAPKLTDVLDTFALPRLVDTDVPVEEDLPAFVDRIEATLEGALEKPPLGDPARTMPHTLAPFTWKAVFQRVAGIWDQLMTTK